jgi:hypothetical protein
VCNGYNSRVRRRLKSNEKYVRNDEYRIHFRNRKGSLNKKAELRNLKAELEIEKLKSEAEKEGLDIG